MIRLPSIPGFQGSAINNPGVSASAAAAPAVALGNLAQGVANVSAEFHNTAVRLQKVENARLASERRQELAKAYADHNLSLQADPDPLSRLEKTQAFLTQAKGSFDDGQLPPAVRDDLVNHFEDFATRAVIRQAEDSAGLSIRRAKGAFENEIKAATDYGDREAFDVAINTAKESGVILPEDEVALGQEFERSQAAAALDTAVATEPATVLAAIENENFLQNYPGVTPQDIPRIRSAARTSAQRMRADQMDLLEAALIEGKLQPEDLEAADYLEPKDRASLKSAISSSRPPDPSAHAKAWNELFSLRDQFTDPSISDEQYAARWNDARSKVLDLLPPAFQGDLKQEISYRSPANRSGGQADERPDAVASDYRTLATQRITKAFESGALGDVKDDKSPAARQAFNRMQTARAEVIRFIKRNPEASWPEIQEATHKALGTTISDGDPDAPLIPAAPPPVSFDTRLNSILGLPGGTGAASATLLPPKP